MGMLLTVTAITLAAALINSILRQRREREIAALAKSWRMHYSPHDVFNLASKVAPHLPLCGAADVRVRDLIYGSEQSGHRYYFSAEFTVGVVRSKARRRCVMTVLESPGRSDTAQWREVGVASPDLLLAEQYQSLRAKIAESSGEKAA